MMLRDILIIIIFKLRYLIQFFSPLSSLTTASTNDIILGSGPSSRRGSLFSGDDSRRPSLLINDEVSMLLPLYIHFSIFARKQAKKKETLSRCLDLSSLMMMMGNFMTYKNLCNKKIIF